MRKLGYDRLQGRHANLTRRVLDGNGIASTGRGKPMGLLALVYHTHHPIHCTTESEVKSVTGVERRMVAPIRDLRAEFRLIGPTTTFSKAVDRVPELLPFELEAGFQPSPGGVMVFVHLFPPKKKPYPGSRVVPLFFPGAWIASYF